MKRTLVIASIALLVALAPVSCVMSWTIAWVQGVSATFGASPMIGDLTEGEVHDGSLDRVSAGSSSAFANEGDESSRYRQAGSDAVLRALTWCCAGSRRALPDPMSGRRAMAA